MRLQVPESPEVYLIFAGLRRKYRKTGNGIVLLPTNTLEKVDVELRDERFAKMLVDMPMLIRSYIDELYSMCPSKMPPASKKMQRKKISALVFEILTEGRVPLEVPIAPDSSFFNYSQLLPYQSPSFYDNMLAVDKAFTEVVRVAACWCTAYRFFKNVYIDDGREVTEVKTNCKYARLIMRYFVRTIQFDIHRFVAYENPETHNYELFSTSLDWEIDSGKGFRIKAEYRGHSDQNRVCPIDGVVSINETGTVAICSSLNAAVELRALATGPNNQ